MDNSHGNVAILDSSIGINDFFVESVSGIYYRGYEAVEVVVIGQLGVFIFLPCIEFSSGAEGFKLRFQGTEEFGGVPFSVGVHGRSYIFTEGEPYPSMGIMIFYDPGCMCRVGLGRGGFLVPMDVFPGLAKGDMHGDGPIMPVFSALQFVNGKDSLIDHCIVRHNVSFNFLYKQWRLLGL